VRQEPIPLEFLMRLANALNATLDLQTIMQQTAELVRAVIDFRIFAILLLNDRTNDLRMRYQVGHTPEAERRRFRLDRIPRFVIPDSLLLGPLLEQLDGAVAHIHRDHVQALTRERESHLARDAARIDGDHFRALRKRPTLP